MRNQKLAEWWTICLASLTARRGIEGGSGREIQREGGGQGER